MDSNKEVHKTKVIVPKEEELKKARKRIKEEKAKRPKFGIKKDAKNTVQEESDNSEFDEELRERTAGVLKDYLKSEHPTQLSYLNFEDDMNAVIEGILREQDIIKKKQKKGSKNEKIKRLKNKLFKRRKNG